MSELSKSELSKSELSKSELSKSELPRVLLLGDSIRMSYQPIVAESCSGWAEVVGPADNCQYSLYTLSSLARWLGQLGTPDVVHWNNGIHDAGHNPARFPLQIPLEMYAANLELTLKQLQQTGAKVIWATSTPVHPDRPFVETGWSWRNEEIDQYNRAALEVMRQYAVPVNDLHSVVNSDVDQYLSEDQLHLSEAGKKRCAAAVVEAVKTQLAKA